MTIMIDPGAQVNTIPLSKYHTLFPNKLTKSGFPKPNALLPTAHTLMSHNGSPKPYLGHFVAEVMHASEPRSYLTCFCMFEDATSPHILLSYATSERLGIVTFNVPNLAATSWVDSVPVSIPPSQQIECTLDDMVDKGVIAPVDKAPTLDEISYCLSGATCFSRLNTKDGF